MSKAPTIGFIGSGNMAQAIIGGLIASGIAPSNLWGSGQTACKLESLKDTLGINTTRDNEVIARESDVIFLAVKPHQLEAVCLAIAPITQKQAPLFISVAAGVTSSSLSKWLGKDARIVRSMPNTPSLIQEGMTGLFATKTVTDDDKTLTAQLLNAAGLTAWVEREDLLDAVTAVSGCGPAYFFLIMEAIEAAGVQLGLTQETARLLTQQTALGAAKMALGSDLSPAELRQNVTSKGGCTAQALDVFEKSRLRDTVMQAMQAADERSKQLGSVDA